jgi:hypothetical protein
MLEVAAGSFPRLGMHDDGSFELFSHHQRLVGFRVAS